MTDEEITLVLRYLDDPHTSFEPVEREILYRLAGDHCTVELTRKQPMMISVPKHKTILISKLPAHIRVALKLAS